jgi:CPA2 family monovalent cation:H+ antiporter-2/glutathione-regulated potassium-efflux system ancillary protein KefC
LLFIAFERLVLPRYADNDSQRESDSIDERGKVLIAGSGRFGQVVNRLLRANGVPTVVLDRAPQQIENMREVDIKSYYGDATRPELLEAAGIDEAVLFVLAIDDREQAVALTRHLKHAHPHLQVLARAFDRGHEYMLREAGADRVIVETYYSALETGKQALRALGVHPFRSEQLARTFDRADRAGRDALYEAWLEKDEGERYGRSFRRLFIELEESLRASMQESKESPGRGERAWKAPPPGYTDDLEER